MPKHSELTFLLKAVLTFSFALYTLEASPATETLSLNTTQVDPLYDTMFRPHKHGWLGADGAASVAISPDAVLWIFGDTIIGHEEGGTRKGYMPHNSVAITKLKQGGAPEVQYWWDLPDRVPAAPFRPDSPDDPTFYWPGCGVAANGHAYLFLGKMSGKVEQNGGFGFHTRGTTLFRIENPLDPPEKWQMRNTDVIAADDHFNINAGALVENSYVYLIGYDDGLLRNALMRSAILSRLAVAALDSERPGDALEFWTKDNEWRTTTTRLQPLFGQAGTETGIAYNAKLKRYITSTVKPFTPELCVFSAEKLTGPWSGPQVVYKIPEMEKDTKRHAYAGRVHPMLSSVSSDLVISYVVNSTDFWGVFNDLQIYFPRFVRLTFK